MGTNSGARRIVSMAMHWFYPPVYISTAKGGERYAVTSIERAGEFLLSWRKDCAIETWYVAVHTCMAAIKNEGPIVDARKAFEDAARECGMLA